MQESKNIEFKREYVDDIRKTIVAFANTDGGTLYIGIEDNGNVIGVENTDDCMLRVSNTIRDSIKPDVRLFIDISVVDTENKNVVKISVQRGTNRPYYIAQKGIRPEGVYLRTGASTIPATETAILNMIKETANYKYEDELSINQNLTFRQADEYFTARKIPFNYEQKRTLHLLNSDNSYTNLALLLSDQCCHTIKFAVFYGNNKTTFKDRKEFSGSLLKQVDDAYQYIDMYNHTSSYLNGLERIDVRSYPQEAIREALLNSVVHREYSFSSSTLISIFDEKIEFVSIGGLVKGICIDDIKLGISVLRNKNLADIFYRLHLIEAYGTGIPKIMECYQNSSAKPEIEISDNAFKLTLPKFSQTDNTSSLNDSRENDIIELLADNGNMTRTEIQSALSLSQSTVLRELNNMLSKKTIKKVGSGRNTKYSVANK